MCRHTARQIPAKMRTPRVDSHSWWDDERAYCVECLREAAAQYGCRLFTTSRNAKQLAPNVQYLRIPMEPSYDVGVNLGERQVAYIRLPEARLHLPEAVRAATDE